MRNHEWNKQHGGADHCCLTATSSWGHFHHLSGAFPPTLRSVCCECLSVLAGIRRRGRGWRVLKVSNVAWVFVPQFRSSCKALISSVFEPDLETVRTNNWGQNKDTETKSSLQGYVTNTKAWSTGAADSHRLSSTLSSVIKCFTNTNIMTNSWIFLFQCSWDRRQTVKVDGTPSV